MIEELLKYKDERNEGLDKYTRIAGGDSGIAGAATLWEQHAKLFEMISAIALHEWESEKDFNSAELAAYKSGLAEIPAFLSRCAAIIESKREAKKDN